MSGEIKILFYIIVGIIYLISTYYGREKKKQSQRDLNKRPIDDRTAEDIFEELKRSILPPPEPLPQSVQTAKPQEISLKKKARQPEISQNYNDFLKHRKKPVENTFVEEAHFKQNHESKVLEAEEKEMFDSGIDFEEMDPRKAFIYGEIFRRPLY